MASAEMDSVLRYLAEHRPAERSLAGSRGFVDVMGAMQPPLPEVVVERVVLGDVSAERLVPPDADLSRALLYFHGGGYSFGSARGYRPFATRIARAFGGVVLVPDYRLAPEHPYPAATHDAVAAWHRAAALVGGAKRMVVAGDSAGGGLALATLLSLRDAGEPLPAAAALLSPWVDLEASGAASSARAKDDPIVTPEGIQLLAQMYLGDRDRRSPLASPTFAALRGLPPTLVQLGTRETQHDDMLLFVDKLRAAGVDAELEVWEGMIHVFQMFPVLPEARRAVARIGEYLRDKVAERPA